MINFEKLNNNIQSINDVITSEIDSISNIYYNNISLSLLSLNIRSIRAHFVELSLLLNSVDYKYNVLCLSETWLLEEVNFALNGYKSFISLGTLNKSDGIYVLVRDCYTILNINKMILPMCNSIELTLTKQNIKYIITAVYRSPSIEINQFLFGLNTYLNCITDNDNRTICGDFNIDISQCNHSAQATKYINLMAEYGFISCINSSTRVTQNAKSCIDHIFVKGFVLPSIKSYVLKSDLTDHFITILTITNFQCDKSKIDNTYLKYNKYYIDFKQLNTLISNVKWSEILNVDCVDNAVNIFNVKISEAITYCSKVYEYTKKKI